MFRLLQHLTKTEHQAGLSLRPRKYFFRDIIVVLGVVLVWRGVWNLIDYYLLPDQPFISNGIGIILGLFFLYLPDGNFSHLSGDGHHEHHHYHHFKEPEKGAESTNKKPQS